MAMVPSRAQTKVVGIGLIGTGDIIRRGFVAAVRETAGAKVTAVLSNSLSRSESFAREIDCAEAYQDLTAFLRSPNVQAVILATPDAAHERQVIEAAAAGVHVLCSKPMTSTYAGCLRMMDAVSKSGIVFAMSHPLRTHNAFRRIREIIASGRLGKVRLVRALWTRLRLPSDELWRTDPRQTHFWALGRHGFHLVDLSRWYFGDPVEVQVRISNPRYGGPNDELSLVVLTYPDGLVVEIVVSILFKGGNSLEIYGEEGVLLAKNIFQYSLERSPITLDGDPIFYDPNNVFAEQVENFVSVIQGGGSLISGIEDGMRSVKIVERALEAARSGENRI